MLKVGAWHDLVPINYSVDINGTGGGSGPTDYPLVDHGIRVKSLTMMFFNCM